MSQSPNVFMIVKHVLCFTYDNHLCADDNEFTCDASFLRNTVLPLFANVPNIMMHDFMVECSQLNS